MEMVMQNVIDVVQENLKSIEGWCSLEKATKLINCIADIKPDLCVEIGVFGGSSFIPQALAIKENGKGEIVGIDPWSNESALEEMQDEANVDWWSKLDIDYVYRHFLANLEKFDIKGVSKIIKDKAENVYNQFEDDSIDLLHIDGNHSELLAYKDATLYLSKVKIGGYIFFDDIHWHEVDSHVTTRKAINFLLQYCQKEDIVNGDCLIMKKIISL
jgi:hypothetical protein